MFNKISQIPGLMKTYSGREWDNEQTDTAITLAITDALPDLGYHRADCVQSFTLPPDASSIPLPTGFMGVSRFDVDGARAQRTPLSAFPGSTGALQYALEGMRLRFSPSGGGAATLRYRGIARTGGFGDGVSADNSGGVLYETHQTSQTDAKPDAHGRWPILWDATDISIDDLDASYNAIQDLVSEFPDVFLYGALKHTSVMVQDFEGAERYAGLAQSAIRRAKSFLHDRAYGADKLRMRRYAT